MTDHERLTEIENRAAKATEGPWDTFLHGKRWLLYSETARDDGIDWFIADFRNNAGRGDGRDDSDFVLHARSDIPYLLAQLRAAMEENARLREAGEAVLALPVAKAELAHLDKGIGTATPNKAWLLLRATLNPPGDSTGEVG